MVDKSVWFLVLLARAISDRAPRGLDRGFPVQAAGSGPSGWFMSTGPGHGTLTPQPLALRTPGLLHWWLKTRHPYPSTSLSSLGLTQREGKSLIESVTLPTTPQHVH